MDTATLLIIEHTFRGASAECLSIAVLFFYVCLCLGCVMDQWLHHQRHNMPTAEGLLW